ncbi:outward-rectifier potassium channel Tok1p [[Candida] anglica]
MSGDAVSLANTAYTIRSRLSKITTNLTKTDIDYTSPRYDEDWTRSRQKLQPLFSHDNTSHVHHRPSTIGGVPTRRSSNINMNNMQHLNIDNNGNNAKDQNDRTPGISPSGLVAIRHILNVPLSTLTTLTIKPGEPQFITWYFISSYFPLITACLGPVANMISFIGLIQHWRVDTSTGETLRDEGVLLALNIISLVLGLVGNVSLLMNFSGRIRYLVTQCVSIACWFIASMLLVIDVAISKVIYFKKHHEGYTGPIYTPSEGYWFAVFTAFLYLLCTLILSINFGGYWLQKYPPTFNLGPKQRSLMIFTICLAIWLLGGAILFAHMIEGLTYGSSLYFCTVSVLTIGLGDILPITAGAKVLVLIFSLIGVLIMGLIITMIRQVVLAAGGPTIFWHQIERDRSRELVKMNESVNESRANLDGDSGGDGQSHLPTNGSKKGQGSPALSFRKMRNIRRRAKERQTNLSLVLTVLNFMAFWCIGATVFYFTEGWSYFNAFYFCFLCLITIGYGDFHPVTPLGRVFFVCWGISAIPLMTILISNVGDKLYFFANKMSYFMAKWFFPEYYRFLLQKRRRRKRSHATGSLSASTSHASSSAVDKSEEEAIVDEMETGDRDSMEEYLHGADDSTKHDLEIDSKEDEPTDAIDDLSVKSASSLREVPKRHIPRAEVLDLGLGRSGRAPSTHDAPSHSPTPPPSPPPPPDDIHLKLTQIKNQVSRVATFIDHIKPLIADTVDEPTKKYTHEEWKELLQVLNPEFADDPDHALNSITYWLSEASPLRLPLNEPNYLLMKFVLQMERELKGSLVDEVSEMERILK